MREEKANYEVGNVKTDSFYTNSGLDAFSSVAYQCRMNVMKWKEGGRERSNHMPPKAVETHESHLE